MLFLLTMVGGIGVARASAQPSGPLMVPPPGKAALERIPLLKDVDIIQKLGEKIPLDLAFVDENGKPIGTPGSIVVTGANINSQDGQSAGCNVVGLYSMIGPYYIESSAIGSTIVCTVKITLRNGQVFQVDPEMQVEGGGVEVGKSTYAT